MKPNTPAGTRDFGPEIVRKREYIITNIKSIFEVYGFEPIETPAFEHLETLLGKYGEEGDKLIFRILDSGNPFSEQFFIDLFAAFTQYNKTALNYINQQGIYTKGPLDIKFLEINPKIFHSFTSEFLDNKSYSNYLKRFKDNTTSKALRYDLTIPFARFFAMNFGKLPYPFKRYQIQPVWRGDKPQKGRYREFYQCDVDIVGSKSLFNEIELLNIYLDVFQKLGINVEISINSRQILVALAEMCEAKDRMMDITIAIDKLEKIGIDGVLNELINKGFNKKQVGIIQKYLLISKLSGNNDYIISQLQVLFEEYEIAHNALADFNKLLLYLKNLREDFQFENVVKIDPTLARGLNYYTGFIFEVKSRDVKIGSIGGGGRYDDLTSLFGLPNISGVGISFGLDRIYDVMEELKLFPNNISYSTKVLFTNQGMHESLYCLKIVQLLRKVNIASEVFPDKTKIDKQFKYAEKKKIPFVVTIGTKEIASRMCTIKNIISGEQESISFEHLINKLVTLNHPNLQHKV